MLKSKVNLKFDHARMHRDVIKKLNSLNKNQRWFTERTGLSRTQLQKLRQGKGMELNTFIRFCNWLENPVYDYIN